jgi:hypothetical protein
MKMEIANRLYESKYKAIISKERFTELLERGLNLIHQDGISKQYKAIEQNALEIGLAYITEEMLQH